MDFKSIKRGTGSEEWERGMNENGIIILVGKVFLLSQNSIVKHAQGNLHLKAHLQSLNSIYI